MKKGGFTIGQYIVILVIIVLINILLSPIIKKTILNFKNKSYEIKKSEIIKAYDKCLGKKQKGCSSIKFLLNNNYFHSKRNCKRNCLKNSLDGKYWDNCYVTYGGIYCNKATNASQKIINLAKKGSKNNSCTEDLLYDKTKDNNLRYTGEKPCNYVSFNGDAPKMITKYRLQNDKGFISEDFWYTFDTFDECNKAFTSNRKFYENNHFFCKEENVISGGWRIVGIMNNIDNGTGKKETRIKLMKDEPIGSYPINSSNSKGDWSNSILMKELNSDYLNNQLKANTTWFKDMTYDYTRSLNKESKYLIENANWQINETKKNNNASNTYKSEKEKKWTGKVGLISLSDYAYAIGGKQRNKCLLSSFDNYTSNRCNETNYLFSNKTAWFINSHNGQTYVNKLGKIVKKEASLSYNVRPTIYLKPNVLIIDGDGSLSSPYILGV